MNNARETKSKKREGVAQRVALLPFVFAMCFWASCRDIASRLLQLEVALC